MEVSVDRFKKRLLQATGASALLAVSMMLGSCSVWRALEAQAYPQNQKDLAVLKLLAQPNGINLVADDALDNLRHDSEIVGLQTVGRRFDVFLYVAQPSMSGYAEILELIRFSPPAFLERKPVGFMTYDFPLFDHKLTGREYYFDASYQLCNNMLFSTHPLNTARLVLIVFDEQSSYSVMGKPGLLCLYAHSDSQLFKAIRNK
jgi:hypothetical protein